MSRRVAAIVGASRGTGLATARELVGAGWHVALLARTQKTLESAAATLGADAHPIAMDVADPASVDAAFRRIGDELGDVYALVNNAAVAWPTRLEHASNDELLTQINTNLLGPLLTMRAAIPSLRRTGGHIVNISSESAQDPFPMLGLYAATKSALEVLTQSLVHELAPDGIRLTLLRSGRTSGGGFTASWGERRAEMMALWESQGFLQRSRRRRGATS